MTDPAYLLPCEGWCQAPAGKSCQPGCTGTPQDTDDIDALDWSIDPAVMNDALTLFDWPYE